jgi:2'-hydroxyisoflavone reductase
MRLLILGGTVFLGRHIVTAAQARGHTVTLFNRGHSAPDAFPDVEQIHGDREDDLGILEARTWDAVIDTSGYVPRIVRASVEALSTEHYTFISSLSAYGSFQRIGLNEDDPPAELHDPASEDVSKHYAELKAACEHRVTSALLDRALVVRPGLIVGPDDPTERFTYWVRRLAEGGRVLAPDARDQPVQWIDVDDLSVWVVALAERGAHGTYNATGPAEPVTFGEMLERIRIATGGQAELVWADPERLVSAGVEPWQDLPLWLDLPRDPELLGFMSIDVRRALKAGLELSPLERTVAATLSWVRTRPGIPSKNFGVPITPAGLSPKRESELLAAIVATQ